MELKKLSDLKSLLKDKPVKRLALAAAQDQQSLGAVLHAWEDRIVEPILVGNSEKIKKVAEEQGYDISGLRIIDEPDLDKATELAVKIVSSGDADVLMKGKVG
ncbi:MAG: phosphate butyryltransferase, partial [Bacteroidia bacterium]